MCVTGLPFHKENKTLNNFGSRNEANRIFCCMLQLCGGGSVTDLVQGLKKRGQVLTTDQIGYILHETVQVRIKDAYMCEGINAARREQARILAPAFKKNEPVVYSHLLSAIYSSLDCVWTDLTTFSFASKLAWQIRIN